MDITLLNRQRGYIKAQITRMNAYLSEEAKEADEIKLTSKLDIMTKLESKSDELKVEYYRLLKDEELVEHEKEFSEIDDSIQDIKVSLKRLLNTLTTVKKNDNIVTHTNDVVKQTNVKLPEIPLPRFSGLYTEWLFFKSQFKTLINDNNELTDQQKLYYLQSALTGNAKQIESLEDSYQSLWKALIERFENKRLIVNGHIQELLNFNRLKSESSKELQALIDCLLKNLRALNQLELKQNKFSELMLINIIVPKLDPETRKMYEMSVISNVLPEWDAFIELLQKRLQILENIRKDSVFPCKEKMYGSKSKAFLLKESSELCKCCRTSSFHPLFRCPTYQSMEVKKRFDFVKRNGFCVNCLSSKHSSRNKCVSNSRCQICHMTHHTSLHFRKTSEADNNQNKNQTSGLNERSADCATDRQSRETTELSNCLFSRENKTVLLSTAIVYIKDIYGNYLPFRCILDVGSQSCYATTNCIDVLKIKRHPTDVSVYGLHSSELKVKSKVYAAIANKDRSYERTLELLVVPKISDVIPSNYLDVSDLLLPHGINLADPGFFKPSKIDIIIGAQYFYELIDSQQISLDNGRIMLRKSVFGFIVAGSLNKLEPVNKVYCGLVEDRDHTEDLNVIMKDFWETEECKESNSRGSLHEGKY